MKQVRQKKANYINKSPIETIGNALAIARDWTVEHGKAVAGIGAVAAGAVVMVLAWPIVVKAAKITLIAGAVIAGAVAIRAITD